MPVRSRQASWPLIGSVLAWRSFVCLSDLPPAILLKYRRIGDWFCLLHRRLVLFCFASIAHTVALGRMISFSRDLSIRKAPYSSGTEYPPNSGIPSTILAFIACCRLCLSEVFSGIHPWNENHCCWVLLFHCHRTSLWMIWYSLCNRSFCFFHRRYSFLWHIQYWLRGSDI